MPTDPHPTAALDLRRHALNGPTMGTRWSAIFFAGDRRRRDVAGIGAGLQASVEAVDRQMSTYIADSDLMRVNRADVGAWVEVPAALMIVIAAGLDIGRRSGGAFDIAIGDLVAAWGFGAAAHPVGTELPPGGAPRRPAHEMLEVDSAGLRVRKLAPLALDLSGIAKGYGVDRVAETLDGFGLADYLVSIDGELRARGRKPGGEPWRVAVERPDRQARDVGGIVELEDAALATSGNYRHVVRIAGRDFAHTIDPRTGRPTENGVASVTVQAPTCMLADAWATALLVLGPEKGASLARANGLEALFATHEAGA